MPDEIDGLLADYDARLSKAVQRIENIDSSRLLFAERFTRARRSIIRPVFETLQERLTAAGHAAHIVETEYEPGPNHTAVEQSPKIMLGVSLRKAGQGGEKYALSTERHIGFFSDMEFGLVSGSSTTSQGLGPQISKTPVGGITPEIVNNLCTEWLRELFTHADPR